MRAVCSPRGARGGEDGDQHEASVLSLAEIGIEVKVQEPEPAPVEPRPEREESAKPEAATRRSVKSEVNEIEGRVLDSETRDPVAGCALLFFRDERRVGQGQSHEDGVFSVRVRGELRGQLVAQAPRGWIIREPVIELRGVALQGLVLNAERWPPESAGSVSGWLRSEKGPWKADDLPSARSISLDLVSLGQPRILRQAPVVIGETPEGEIVVGFSFGEVPRGEYELTLSSLGHYRWSPRSMHVIPPAESLEFVRHDEDQTADLVFSVIDAESGLAIEDYELFHVAYSVSAENGVLMHVGPLKLDDFPLDGGLDWSVTAEGYAPAYGDELAFQDVDGKLVAEVRMQPGWGTRFVVIGRDPNMRPLFGAKILLDGKSVGITGDDGAVNVLLAAPPEELEVLFRDWQLVRNPLQSRNGFGGRARQQVTMLQMAPPC